MPNKKTEQKKTHTVDQVDAFTARATVDGYAECFGVVVDTQEQVLGALNTVMGIYMEDDLNRYKDRVAELSLIHTSVLSFYKRFEYNYFAKLEELKEFAEREESKLEKDNY